MVEIATDKANTEIPSPSSGVLVEQIAKEGSVVAVGAALAKLDESGAGAPAKAAPQAAPAGGDGVKATPVGRNVAQEHGIDLSKVPGSGAQGRVTKADVTSYVEKGATAAQQSEHEQREPAVYPDRTASVTNAAAAGIQRPAHAARAFVTEWQNSIK